MVELRLNDLLPATDRRYASQSLMAPTVQPAARHPTLLETTLVFPPNETMPPYLTDADQVLKRVRRHTRLDTISYHVASLGDPLSAPFALFGLPNDRNAIQRCLRYPRFAVHGLHAIVVDLTRTARAALSWEWRRDLRTLLEALGAVGLTTTPAVVVLCDDGFVTRGAESLLRTARHQRKHVIRSGALVFNRGILQAPDATTPEFPPLSCDADVKDASLRPVRDRLMELAHRLRDAGHTDPAFAVGSTVRVLSAFASLPLGIAEARNIASLLFDSDEPSDIKARSLFFPSARLQRMADAEAVAPEFAAEIRTALDEVKAHVQQWEKATPVSLKIRRLLDDAEWNARDVLLVLPDVRTMDVFLVSDAGVACDCTVVDATEFVRQADTAWRRIIIVRPEPKLIRVLMTMRATASRVLCLGDAAGAASVANELDLLASIPDFAPFAARARALDEALKRGGADAAIDFAEAEFRYRLPDPEDLIDLTRASDGYAGPIVRLHLEGGAQAAYRPLGDVLRFTPDEIRPFAQVAAQDVNVGDKILVLRKEIRDRLSEALMRSRKTAAQLRVYHDKIARYRRSLPGTNLSAKARAALAAMHDIDASISEQELPNIRRWLSVEPSEAPQPPRAARDRRRFRIFVQAAGLDEAAADAFWNLAILPVRAYSAVEGHVFNRRIVQFVVDPEGVAAGTGWHGYQDLWQSVVDAVEEVVDKELTHG